MSEHLSPAQLKRLGAYQLKGDALLDALKHIEECEECRAQIESPTKAELIDQLFRDEDQSGDESEDESDRVEDSSEPADERAKDKTHWRERLKKFLRGPNDPGLMKSFVLFFSIL